MIAFVRAVVDPAALTVGFVRAVRDPAALTNLFLRTVGDSAALTNHDCIYGCSLLPPRVTHSNPRR